MLEILREVLNQTTGPEMVAQIDEAHDLFDQFELQDFTLEFEELLSVSDNNDAGSLNTDIYNLTRVFQDQILDQHLIILNPEITLAQANHVLRCIKLIETTEFTHEVVDICLNGTSNYTDTFVEILSTVGGLPVEEVATYIKFVEISLIKKILQLMTKRVEVEALDTIDHNSIETVVERYKLFVNNLHYENPPLTTKYISEGAMLLEPFEIYCKYIREHLTSTDPKEIASEYVAAAIISSNVPALFKESIVKQLNKLYTDIDQITPIVIAVDGYMLDMQANLTTGIKKVEL